MTVKQLTIDDPRLTAFALGELDAAEMAEIERLLAGSPECRAAVEEIRTLAGVLSSELQHEPAPALTDAQRATIVAAARQAESGVAPAQSQPAGSARKRWTTIVASVATVAAMLMVVVLITPAKRSRDSGGTDFRFSAEDQPHWPGRHSLDPSMLGTNPASTPADGLELAERRAATTLTRLRFRRVENFADRDSPESPPAEVTLKNQAAVLEQKDLATQAELQARKADARLDELKLRRQDLVAPEGETSSARFGFTQSDSSNERGRSISQFSTSAGTKPIDIGGTPPAPPTAKRGPVRASRPAVAQSGQQAGKPVDAAPRRTSGNGVVAGPSGGAQFQERDSLESLKGKGDVSREAVTELRGISIQGNEQDVGSLKRALGQTRSEFDDFRATPSAGGRGWHSDLSRLGKIVDARGGFPVQRRGLRERSSFGAPVYESTPGTEAYDPITENPFVTPLNEPLSTFGVDVDTASYSNMRRFLTAGQMPPRNAVRIEELVNYFRYDDAPPGEARPFSVNVEVGRAPWRPEHRLVRIGLKGREIPRDKRPLSNLVFLVDVSGSMASENKLPLVKAGLSLLTEQLGEGDRVAIVTYSDTATLRLDSTTGDRKQAILDVINALQAGGSTNGAGGIQLAYDAAVRHFIEGGTNRVILCTDGDFNVGVTSDDALVQLIQERARTKIFFSVFGFGMGNLKDGKLEKLADKGNGHYAYVDGMREAKKVFVDELSGTLVTIAKDVKVQVEFNPARVGAYRLIGYENRALAAQDFDNDKKDAGDIGAGHSVTALYEIVPTTPAPQPVAGEGLRYPRSSGIVPLGDRGIANELLAVKLRYKPPEEETSALIEFPAIDPAAGPFLTPEQSSRPASRDFQWASAVAAFGMILRDSHFRGQAGFDLVLELAQGAKGDDANGQRQEFIDLVQRAKSLRPDLARIAAQEPAPAATAAASNTDGRLVPLSGEAAERLLGKLVGGKYKNLLRIVPAPNDGETYGQFHDFGRWEGPSYLGHQNLPQGHWVYLYPNWYIWGDAR